MSDLNDLIHTNAVNAFEQGVKSERARIYKLLKPLALCQIEDCHDHLNCEAYVYSSVIQKILDIRLHENTREQAENVQKVINVDLKPDESARTDEFIEGMAAAHDVVMGQLDKMQNGANVWHSLTESKEAESVANALQLFAEMFQDAYFDRIDGAKQ